MIYRIFIGFFWFSTLSLCSLDETTIFDAIQHNRRIDFFSLISMDKTVVHHRKNGAYPLHYAALFGRFFMAQFLINNHAHIDIKDSKGSTPLFYALIPTRSSGWERKNVAKMVRLLLMLGAEVNAANNHGYTPLHIAVNLHQCEAAELLLHYGAHLKQPSYLWLFIYDGTTPQQLALYEKQEQIIPLFNNWHAVHESLLAFSAAMHPRLGKESSARHLDQYSLRMIAEYVLDLKRPLLISNPIDTRKIFYRSLIELAALGIGLFCVSCLWHQT
jgi:hypothetical protein